MCTLINLEISKMASSSSSSPTMDVRIETEDQNSFTLRIGQNDTVYAVKARIYKATGTPMFHQILGFNGRILENSCFIHTYEITPNSRLVLCIQDPLSDLGGFPAPPIKAELLLNVAKHPEPFLRLSVYISETVLQLKQKVLQHCQGLPPPDRLGVYVYGKRHALQDAKCLSDYGLSNGSKLDVFITPPPGPLPPTAPKKGNIQVLTPCGKRLHLRVKARRKVQVLRAELERLQMLEQFELPSHYFFVHDFSVLDEKMSFRGNFVEKNDEIEIVSGSIHLMIEGLRKLDEIHVFTCRFSPLLRA